MTTLQRFLFLGGIVLQLFLAIASLQHKGLTWDEYHHYSYGLGVLHGSPQWQNVPEMPFSVLNVLFSDKNSDLESQIKTGRLVTVFFLWTLSIIVFHWSKELYGTTAAIFSLFLFCLDPNFIAHGHLVTCDIYAAVAITLALYCFWKFLKHGGYRYAILSATTLGISQLAKYTSLYLYPIFLFIVIFKFSPVIVSSFRERNFGVLGGWAKSFLKYFSMFLLINILIINAGYSFYKPFFPLKDYAFKSHTFKSLQTVGLVNSIPLPLPYPFIDGLDFMRYIDDTGQTFGNMYLLGRLHDKGKGFKSYYFIAMLFKVPIATLFIIFMALVNDGRARKKGILRDETIFFLLPVTFYLILFSLFFNTDIGIRYILFIFPLLYVFCGSLFVSWGRYSFMVKAFFMSLMLYLAGSVFSYFPHYISYFNELVPDRKMAYKILADSNLDWRGDEWYVNEYLKKHPESILLPPSPVPGRIIVNVNDLVGVFEPQKFAWLRDNFEPIDQIAYSWLVYDIKWSDIERLLAGTAHPYHN